MFFYYSLLLKNFYNLLYFWCILQCKIWCILQISQWCNWMWFFSFNHCDDHPWTFSLWKLIFSQLLISSTHFLMLCCTCKCVLIFHFVFLSCCDRLFSNWCWPGDSAQQHKCLFGKHEVLSLIKVQQRQASYIFKHQKILLRGNYITFSHKNKSVSKCSWILEYLFKNKYKH